MTNPAHLSPATSLPRRMSVALATLLVAGIALVGCVAPAAEPGAPGSTSVEDLLSSHDLAGLDVEQVIERLDTMPKAERPEDLLASVQPDALVLRDDSGRETRMPLPDDWVYISVAPFRDQTHECHFHSLTTCVGELGDTEVRVIVTAADGEVMIDETRRTYDNGFTGLWLPRGITATLTIEHDGETGSVPISTRSPDDATCVTTLRLL